MSTECLAIAEASNATLDVALYIPFARWCVRRFLARTPSAGRHRDDLTSEAMLALVTAASRFDPLRGVPFKRYAGARIDGRLSKRFLSITRQESHTVGDCNVDTVTTQASNNDETDDLNIEGVTAELLDSLTDLQREIVKAHYIEGLSIGEIATAYAKSRNTVCHIIYRGLRRMRRTAATGGVS